MGGAYIVYHELRGKIGIKGGYMGLWPNLVRTGITQSGDSGVGDRRLRSGLVRRLRSGWTGDSGLEARVRSFCSRLRSDSGPSPGASPGVRSLLRLGVRRLRSWTVRRLRSSAVRRLRSGQAGDSGLLLQLFLLLGPALLHLLSSPHHALGVRT